MMLLVDCCPDPRAEPAGVGEYPFGADTRGLCCVCGRGKTLPHEWCPGVAASLHRRNSHPLLRPLVFEHGTVGRFKAGCHCMRCMRCVRCVRAWLQHVEHRL